MRNRKILTTGLLAVSLIVTSCEKVLTSENFELILPSEYGKTLADKSHKNDLIEALSGSTEFGETAVFGDIYSVAGIPKTKANLPEIPFLDLLDMDQLKEINIDGISVTEIPFKNSIDFQEMALQYPEEQQDGWTASRRFFVFIEDAEGCFPEIVTLVPTRQVLQKFGPKSFSFIDRSRFDGVILHCDLEGNFISTITNKAGPAYNAELGAIDNSEDNEKSIIMQIPILTQTKGTPVNTGNGDEVPEIDGGDIVECIHIGVKNRYPVTLGPFLPTDEGQGFTNEDNNPLFGGGGGGNKNNKFRGDPFLYSLTISKEGNGEVVGAGAYSKGYNVTVKAISSDEEAFVRWEGAFAGRDNEFVYTIMRDTEATAIFQEDKSCYDSTTKTNATINSFTIAPTDSGNIIGGMFGQTRYNQDGTKKQHNGIDFLAEEGTPIYAPKDGIVTVIKNNIGEGKKESNRSHGTGNMIQLKCGDVYYNFFHLRSPEHGGGIAPGITVGTNVRRGQKIGWTGATGNAYNVKHKHLHLETIVNGKYVNPEKYINGTINKETGAIVVNCDSEYQNTSEDNPGTLWDNAKLYW